MCFGMFSFMWYLFAYVFLLMHDDYIREQRELKTEKENTDKLNKLSAESCRWQKQKGQYLKDITEAVDNIKMHSSLYVNQITSVVNDINSAFSKIDPIQ